MTRVFWGHIVGMLVLVVAFGCDEDSPRNPADLRATALSDSIEAGYSRLQQAYADADSLPPHGQRMRKRMEAMHGRMHTQRGGMGRGRHHHGGMHEGGRMRGEGGMHGPPQPPPRRGGRRDSTQMWEWHQQMGAMHGRMVRMHAQHGRDSLAARHRQMQRRHRTMMDVLPSQDDEASAGGQPVPPAEVRSASGEDLYVQHCGTCHGQQGRGIGPFPPLAGASWVTGEEDTAIHILLHGLQGPIEVNDRSYSALMPSRASSVDENRCCPCSSRSASCASSLVGSWWNRNS